MGRLIKNKIIIINKETRQKQDKDHTDTYSSTGDAAVHCKPLMWEISCYRVSCGVSLNSLPGFTYM